MKPVCLRRRLALAGLMMPMVPAVAQAPAAEPPLPPVSVGTLQRLQGLRFDGIAPRPVEVWLPRGYSPARRHAVLYLHDGQALFDPAGSLSRSAWGVDVTVQRLIDEGRIPDTLVVAVWNTGATRHSEYHPEKMLANVPEPVRSAYVQRALAGRPRADAYLRFLVDELKPAVDRQFATRPGREHTVVMGSSMGGLISIYALSEYPQVFGAAGALSTHWPGRFEANSHLPLAAFIYLRDHLPPAGRHRLYMDHGTTELDALYAPYQAIVDQIVRDKGYTAADSLSRVFPGTGHNEREWAARLPIPLQFLLGPLR